MNPTFYRAALVFAAFCTAPALLRGADLLFPEWLPRETAAVVAIAVTNHPSVKAASYESMALWQDRKALDPFYDPSLSAAGGISRAPEAAPESGLSSYLPDDSAGVQVGLNIPVRQGAYIGLGAAQRRVDGCLSDGSAAWQTIAGARVSVPLLRDRGFSLQKLSEKNAEAAATQSSYAYASTIETASRNAAVAFAYELYAGALVVQYRKALERVQILLGETSERVKLETVAEYQLFPAEAEVQFKLDDLRQAAAAYTNAHHSLELALGGVSLPYQDISLLSRWAVHCSTSDVSSILATSGRERPEVTAAKWAVIASESLERKQEESLRSSLTLSAGVGYQGETDRFGIGDECIVRERTAGVGAAIVWSRPLSFDSQEAALHARCHRTNALRQEVCRLERAAEMELNQARALFDSAIQRLSFAGKAVESAAKALESESDRLKMGEGRSRNVLDAQTDLTSAEGRVNLVSYDVVCSFLDLMLAGGVPFSSAFPNVVSGNQHGGISHLALEE